MNATSSGRGRRRRPKPVTVFFDRNLGKSLPRALDILPQLKVKHMRDVYPNDGQEIEDTEWLARAGAEGWVVFTQDARVWQNLDEHEALINNGVRVFCLGTPQATATQKAVCYGRHILPILRRARRPGPCFWRIYPERVDKLLR